MRRKEPQSYPPKCPARRGGTGRQGRMPDACASGRGDAERRSLDGTHFHDLRHTGNTLSSDAGANIRELMARMGHSSMRAAVIYQHSSDARQRAIADVIGKQAKRELRKAKKAKAEQAETADDSDAASGTELAHEQRREPKTRRARQDSNPRPAA
jgi:hypothetical protein